MCLRGQNITSNHRASKTVVTTIFSAVRKDTLWTHAHTTGNKWIRQKCSSRIVPFAYLNDCKTLIEHARVPEILCFETVFFFIKIVFGYKRDCKRQKNIQKWCEISKSGICEWDPFPRYHLFQHLMDHKWYSLFYENLHWRLLSECSRYGSNMYVQFRLKSQDNNTDIPHWVRRVQGMRYTIWKNCGSCHDSF